MAGPQTGLNGPKRAQTGLKLKIVLRAGPGKGTTGRAGPKNIVILPSLLQLLQYSTRVKPNKTIFITDNLWESDDKFIIQMHN